jgi:hypothetical protein
MAELHVQRKRHGLLWLWIIVIILLIAGGIYFYLHNKNPRDYPLPGKSSSVVLHENPVSAGFL